MKKVTILIIASLFMICSLGTAMACEAEPGSESPGEAETASETSDTEVGETGDREVSKGEYRCSGEEPRTAVERLKYRFMCGDS